MTSVFPLIAQGDNIKIHEDGAGAPSITQWTVVPGTAQALTSWLLYTRGQTGWNMRSEDMRSSQNAKLFLSPPPSLTHSLPFSPHCALQPIWRLINPEGLLFRWGFSLFPPTALHPFSPPTPPLPPSHPFPLPARFLPLLHHIHALSYLIPASPILSSPWEAHYSPKEQGTGNRCFAFAPSPHTLLFKKNKCMTLSTLFHSILLIMLFPNSFMVLFINYEGVAAD